MPPWPPPPDRASIQELFQTADVEGFLSDGAPPDEYEGEADAFLAAIEHLPTAHITETQLFPHLEIIWRSSFALDDAALAQRRPALMELARQTSRFFGPEAQPKVRNT